MRRLIEGFWLSVNCLGVTLGLAATSTSISTSTFDVSRSPVHLSLDFALVLVSFPSPLRYLARPQVWLFDAIRHTRLSTPLLLSLSSSSTHTLSPSLTHSNPLEHPQSDYRTLRITLVLSVGPSTYQWVPNCVSHLGCLNTPPANTAKITVPERPW